MLASKMLPLQVRLLALPEKGEKGWAGINALPFLTFLFMAKKKVTYAVEVNKIQTL